jgi:hypothetical protein
MGKGDAFIILWDVFYIPLGNLLKAGGSLQNLKLRSVCGIASVNGKFFEP